MAASCGIVRKYCEDRREEILPRTKQYQGSTVAMVKIASVKHGIAWYKYVILKKGTCLGQNNIKGQPLQWWQARKSWRSAEKRQLTLSKWVLLVCGPYSFFLSDNIIKSGKYDWSLCYVSVGGSIFKAHTVDWVVNEGRQATVEKNSNFCLIWSEARWGVVLLQLSRLSIVILMNWLRDSCSATQSWTVEILQIGLSLNA